MVEQPEEASSGSRPEQGDHAVRDLRDGLIPLPLPDQHPAPREVAAHHHLELGSELGLLPGSLLAWETVLLALHSLPHSAMVARLDHLGYQLKEGVRSAVYGGGHGNTWAARCD